MDDAHGRPVTTQSVVLVLFVIFMVYRRTMSVIGFQPFRPWRIGLRLGLLAFVAAIRLAIAVFHPVSLIADALGAAAGAALATYAVRHAAFERRGEQWFFKTHPWIGAVVAGLLLIRLAMRGPMLFQAIDDSGAVRSLDPSTAALFFVVVAYNLGFSGWIVWKLRNDPPAVAVAPLLP